jgi:hypothetical protein
MEEFDVFEADSGSWHIDSFDVAFEDGSGNPWTVTLEDSRWAD